jgi:hypothetical protein
MNTIARFRQFDGLLDILVRDVSNPDLIWVDTRPEGQRSEGQRYVAVLLTIIESPQEEHYFESVKIKYTWKVAYLGSPANLFYFSWDSEKRAVPLEEFCKELCADINRVIAKHNKAIQ